MSGKAHPYPLDLEALPIGAFVVCVDGWGESPTTFRIVERDTHHIVGETSGGERTFLGGSLVQRLARPDEISAFQPPQMTAPVQTEPPSLPAPMQMEMF